MKLRQLTLAMILSAVCIALPANLRADDNYGGGSGEWTDPYIISTTAHLDSLSERVYRGESYQGKYFRLTSDLDYEGRTFRPIGTVNRNFTDTPYHPFAGTFLGNGHSILNVVVNLSESNGIFGYLEGTVKDLTIGGESKYYGCRSMGAIAGSMRDGTISGCKVDSTVQLIIGMANPIAVGGIVGSIKYGSVSNCVNAATINLNNYSGATTIGGIVGGASERGNVYDCYNFGKIANVAYSARHIGSVVGYLSSLSDCYVVYNYYGGDSRGRGGIGNEDDYSATDIERVAEPMYSLDFDTRVNSQILSNTNHLITYNNRNYYRNNAVIKMKLWCSQDVTPGYIGRSTFYTRYKDNPLNEVGDSIFTLTLVRDNTVKLESHSVVRDINYSDWIRISVPSVEYTGEPVTPPVSVTDIKDGTETPLVEGTDFTLVEPEKPFVSTGQHTFYIQGLGNFGNKTAASLRITSPPGTWTGDGTSQSPYVIASVEDMNLLAGNVNNGIDYEGVYFSLVEDLDYQGLAYTPVGNSTNQFKGNFNGNGNTVSNVVIDLAAESYKGLFGNIGNGATISDLTLGTGSSITGQNYVGGIAGSNAGRIIDCRTDSNVLVKGFRLVGGIVGENNTSLSVSGCVNRAVVATTGRTIMDDKTHGGIVGNNLKGKITNCENHGNVDGGTYQAGGIAGSSSGTIQSCFNLGRVSGYQQTGGIAGMTNSGSVSNCLNLGAVVCEKNLRGSIIGENAMSRTSLSNNYYHGSEDAFGAVGNTDYENEAQRGYRISATGDSIILERQSGNAGLRYDNSWYIGADQNITLNYVYNPPAGHLIECFTHNGNNAGTSKTRQITTTEDIEVGVQLMFFNSPWIGKGTAETPYLITSVNEMDQLATYVNDGIDFEGNHFSLVYDLDYAGLTYTPVGSQSTPFMGTFNGNGNAVNNVVVDLAGENYKGLFGNIGSNAVVSNLTLGAGSSIIGRNYVGGIAGGNAGTITDCRSDSNVLIKGFWYVGGIVGGNNTSTGISGCVNHAAVATTGPTIMDDKTHGGIVGDNRKGAITNCENRGNVDGGTYQAGGIAGSSSGTIESCVNLGRVSGYQQTGGIAGMTYSGSVSNCLNLGAVGSERNIRGSIIGENQLNKTSLSNNYYYGSDDMYGAVQDADTEGKAQRGYRISAPGDSIGLERQSGWRGIGYKNAWYIGADQAITLDYDYNPPTGCLLGYFTHNGSNVGADKSRTITTAEDIEVGVVLQEPKIIVIGTDHQQDGYYVATYHDSDNNLIVPQGIEARTYNVSADQLTLSHTYHAGDVIPADEAVVLFAREAKSYSFGLSGECENVKDAASMLRGISGGGVDNEAGYRYYVLASGNEAHGAPAFAGGRNSSALGFYRQNEQGLSVEIEANNAYLKVPETVSAEVTGYPFSQEDFPTAITTIDSSPQPMGDGLWYTIGGQRLQGRPSSPGIYIFNNTKVVVK